MTLSEALKQATITVPVAGRLFFDLGRNASYEAAKAGELPTVKIGGLLRVPVAKLCDMLGIDRGAAAPTKKNGPAEAATSPDRGSSIPQEGKPMNAHTNITATPENLDRPDIGDALDILNRAWSQVELINMAAEAGNVTGHAGNAIAWGCISVQELLKQVKEHLEPRVQFLAKGSKIEAGSNVGHVLEEMLRDHAEVTAAFDRVEGDEECNKLSNQQCELALAIIGYRPLTKGDERRKAEFLRDWSKATLFTEQEQKALVASLQPEGAQS